MTDPQQPDSRPTDFENPYAQNPEWQSPEQPAQSPYAQQQPYGYGYDQMGSQGQLQQPYSEWGVAPYGGHGGWQTEHPQGTTVLVLGVLGLLVAVTGPFAWWMGQRARAEVAAGRYAPSATLTAGWILGIITTVYLAVIVAMVMFFIVALVAFSF